MRKLFALTLVVLALAALAVAISALNGRNRRELDDAKNRPATSVVAPVGNNERRTPVVVELFTSEGCSSCPPADDLLSRLDETQPVAGAEVIALAQHVDYWNNLGWADPFSTHEFSERQGEYAETFGNEGVYTPQMVVDGHAEFPGSNNGRAFETIAQAAREPKADVQLARASEQNDAGQNDAGQSDAGQSDAGDGLRLDVRVGALPKLTDGDTADVLLAVTESGLSSDVARGENAGRRLSHVGVVRRLTKIGYVSAASQPFKGEPVIVLDKSWRRENLRAVVFLQEHTSKRVVGAASLKLFG
ncbi:MAG TPA: DUF1223 domain-containing protein [Pyrinomonadaceae bacterium]|jgi:hypothetical protein|nr:DUF1223 domain-containing protein [Pyrinomonadaceae bacterium]